MSQINIYPISSALFGPSATVVNYSNLWGGTAGWQTAISTLGLFTVGNVVGGSSPITFTGWTGKVQVAPAGAASMTMTVYVNGVSTAMSLVFAGAATLASWSGTLTVNPGDVIVLVSTPSGVPTVTGSKYINFTIKWTSAGNACQVCSAANGNQTIATAGDSQIGAQWGGTQVWAAGDVTGEQSPMPVAGTVQNLYVYLSADPTTGGVHPGETLTVTVYQNVFSGGVNVGRTATALQVVAGTSGVSSNLVNKIHFAQGDMISVRATSSTNCAAEQISFGVEFVADGPPVSLLLGESTASGNSITIYHELVGSSQSLTEPIAQIPMFAATAFNLYQRASTSTGAYVNLPGGGNGTYTMAVRKAAGSTTLTCQVAAGQYANDTAHTVPFVDGDLFNMQSVTGSNAGSTCLSRWGMALLVPQIPVFSDMSQPFPDRREVIAY